MNLMRCENAKINVLHYILANVNDIKEIIWKIVLLLLRIKVYYALFSSCVMPLSDTKWRICSFQRCVRAGPQWLLG